MVTRSAWSWAWCVVSAGLLGQPCLDATGSQALPALAEADRREVSRYQLSETVLDGVIDVNTQLLARVGADRTLREALAGRFRASAPATLDEAARQCESEAQVSRLLEGSGLRTREYLVAQLALIQAVAALEDVRAGLAKAPRPGSSALAFNMAFIEAHPDRVKAFETVFDELAAVLDGGSRR